MLFFLLRLRRRLRPLSMPCHDIGWKKRRKSDAADEGDEHTPSNDDEKVKKSCRLIFAIPFRSLNCYCMCDSFFPPFLFFRSSCSWHARWHLLAWLLLSTNLLLFHATTTSPAGEFEYAGFVDWAGSIHVNNDDCHEAQTPHILYVVVDYFF